MGVGVQGETCGEMTQHAGHRLDVYSVLECDSCEGVAKIMESDLRDTCPFKYSLQHVVYAVRRDWTTVRRGEYIGIIGFLFLRFQNFYRLL